MTAKRIYAFLAAAAFLVFTGCSTVGKAQPGQQEAGEMKRAVTMEMDYLLYLPEDYDAADDRWPLLVFLHGSGERGSNIDQVKVHGPAKLVESGKDFGFVIVSPQCPRDKWWANRTEHVIALIDEIIETYRIDESRIYLTGLSMGGYGTWAVACMYPERFAAIAPLCGGGIPLLAQNLRNIPIWAFHGAKDEVVPVSQSQEMVAAVNSVGGRAGLTIYPDAGHDCWTETYNNEELYQWLLSNSKD